MPGDLRRRLLLAVGAVIAALLVVWAFRAIDLDRRGDGSARTTRVAENASLVACPTRDDSSYGKTAIGQWLRRLLFEVGMPRKSRVAAGDVTDTGTALDVSAYGRRITSYVAASRPPDPELVPEEAELVGQEGAFSIYYREGPSWKSFTALSPKWQLSLLVFPGAGHPSVSWERDDFATAEWFDRAIDWAKHDPPPCS